MATELFVYWRCAAADVGAAERALRALQQRFRQQLPGLLAALYRRSDDGTAGITWMETYARAEGGLTPADRAAVQADAAAALAPWCVGERHEEMFDRLA
ncbi:MAG: DUF4936 family protein [Rubrivivax sp.]